MADETTENDAPDDAADDAEELEFIEEPLEGEEEEPLAPLVGTVAIVGFPNVGKSTLVNRLSGTRQAVVHETSGVTRDRKELVVEWTGGRRFLLIDTGGVDIADETPITRSIAVQAREAVAEADLVLFVVDAQVGITPGDEEVAQILREAKKPVLVIANKIDDPRMEPLALELHALGLGDPIPISGLHGHGAGDLLDEILDYLEAHGAKGREEIPEDAIRVAILGRPNVGKSTLLNKLVGRERVIVSEIPGTTRDSIDTIMERGGRTFVLIDNRRPTPQAPPPPGHRVLLRAARARVRRASRCRARPHRCVRGRRRPGSRRCRRRPQGRQLDADRPLEVGRHDSAHRGRARHAAPPPTPAPAVPRDLRAHRPRPRPPARHGRRSLRPPHRADPDAGTERLPAGAAQTAASRPRAGASASICSTAPRRRRVRPRIRIFVNDPTLVTRDYGYWVENEIRERFGLDGVPVSIDFARRT